MCYCQISHRINLIPRVQLSKHSNKMFAYLKFLVEGFYKKWHLYAERICYTSEKFNMGTIQLSRPFAQPKHVSWTIIIKDQMWNPPSSVPARMVGEGIHGMSKTWWWSLWDVHWWVQLLPWIPKLRLLSVQVPCICFQTVISLTTNHHINLFDYKSSLNHLR